jgi:hypothetical protein
MPSSNPFEDILTALFNNGTDVVSYGDFLIALGLSFSLSLIIGAVYQRTYRGRRYTQDYVHTLVLMGMVVSVVIMVVGENVARAFGIFAAFSIIRFRRALPEARDVGFIFFSMAVGLTAGAREYLFAVLTTALVCAAVLVMSRLDLFAPPPTSHSLLVRVPLGMDYEAAFSDVFARLLDSATLVSTQSVKGDKQIELQFAVQLRAGAAAADLVADIKRLTGGGRVVLQSTQPRRVR